MSVDFEDGRTISVHMGCGIRGWHTEHRENMPVLRYAVLVMVSIGPISTERLVLRDDCRGKNARKVRLGSSDGLSANRSYGPPPNQWPERTTLAALQLRRMPSDARIAGHHAWRGEKEAGGYREVPGFCKSATLDEARKHGYVLRIGR